MLRPSWRLALAFALAIACGESLPAADDGPSLPPNDGGPTSEAGTDAGGDGGVGDDAAIDVATDAGTDAKPCTVDLPYDDPQAVPNLDQLGAVSSVRLHRDGGAFAFVSADLGNASFFDVVEVPFPMPGSAVPVKLRDTPNEEEHPTPLADDLEVYYDEPIDAGVLRIFSATRAQPGQKLDSAGMVDIPLGGATSAMHPWSVAGKRILYFAARTGSSTTNIMRAEKIGGSWSVDPQLTGAFEKTHPVVSDDELVMYLARSESGTRDIFVSTRSSTADPWSAPLLMQGNVNVDAKDDEPSWISPDKCTLIFTSNRGGASRAYQIVRKHE